jgi:hypothetical protein
MILPSIVTRDCKRARHFVTPGSPYKSPIPRELAGWWRVSFSMLRGVVRTGF